MVAFLVGGLGKERGGKGKVCVLPAELGEVEREVV